MENELKFYNGNQTVTIDLSENDIGTCLLFETHKGVTSVVKRFIDYEVAKNQIKKHREDERKSVLCELKVFLSMHSIPTYNFSANRDWLFHLIDILMNGGTIFGKEPVKEFLQQFEIKGEPLVKNLKNNQITKYYVEFVHLDSENSYILQSKWFDTKEDAIKWYKDSFDYIGKNDINVSLMKSDFENGVYNDIKFVEDITAKVYLK